ncbi:XdhC family protein [Roseibium album]|uniref:Putative xanthine dehydrogenase subunit A n=1 Tax=Roseibium album TaxID=311410 RepID=A0A0M6ZIQ6_9HYPH|nr:XdhC/CoxI family protein [Roseibium album]CTQ62659.1 putative xanthine dehydrogenase subunit A [Roseibium album]CTQ78969.1 putative xanthine dehydrogenase subunit A [Roseibium album]CTQ80360.1 putative xanthine dehydrogenase subunit A [Roseibium album]
MKHSSVPTPHSNAGPELTSDLQPLMNRLQNASEPFALATVVRTISVTAAKAGAKAVIAADGSIAGGWIGGGCARSAVIKAARAALEDGEARLVSIQPEDLLAELGVESGEEREGVQFAKNMCPSKGTMDIFVEPVLPRPILVICGASPVALALSKQAPTIGFDVAICAPAEDHAAFPGAGRLIDGFGLDAIGNADTYILVSTQGRGDLAALEGALNVPARHIGFVGSRRKISTLKEKLREKGLSEQDLERIEGPAGLDLGAITPEEIALSILAELLVIRRTGQRQTNIQYI